MAENKVKVHFVCSDLNGKSQPGGNLGKGMNKWYWISNLNP